MAENRISYLNRNYSDYRKSMLDITRKYYGDIYSNFNDASIGAWFVDVFADIADNLSYHIDRTYQETSLDAAQSAKSLLHIARNSGCRVPGPKSALVEVEISCQLPMNAQNGSGTGNQRMGDENYAPILHRGCLFSTGLETFELMEEVNFAEQFDANGITNREIIPTRSSNGEIISYTYKKLALARAGQSKIYKKVIDDSDVKPFMSILLQDNNVLGVDSIIVKDGSNLSNDPPVAEFNVDMEEYDSLKDGNGETTRIQRFFEVENLADQYRFGYECEKTDDGYYNPIWTDGECVMDENGECVTDEDGNEIPVRRYVTGKWKRLKNKFITEYTDNWSLKVTFGSGLRNEYGDIPTDAKEFTQYMMSRMEANDYMGVLPESGKTLYILYRVGGGEKSNIAANSLTNIVYLNMEIKGNCNDGEDGRKKADVRSTLSVTNPTPSYGGKDAPSDDELRYLIKYNNASQNRCVTLRDYYARIISLPARYGTPFRCSVIEENNKVEIYTLGIDSLGHLSAPLAETVAENIKNYLSNYKMINDFVEIRSGKIINVAFEIDIFADKTYEKSDVVKKVINLVGDYMDIRRHQMGEDIFLGDLEKEISKLDGVQNLIELRCYNRNNTDDGYSADQITQQMVQNHECCYEEYEESDEPSDRIDLKASDKILYSDAGSMIELKYLDRDVVVRVKER